MRNSGARVYFQMIDNDVEKSSGAPRSFIFRDSAKPDRFDPQNPIQNFFRDNLGIWASRKFSTESWQPLSNRSETRQVIKSKNGAVEITIEPLLSESLKIWFGREGLILKNKSFVTTLYNF